MIFGDLTSWFLVILNESWKNENGCFSFSENHIKDHQKSPKITNDHEISGAKNHQKSWKWDHQRSSKMFHFNMMIFHDIWWFFVTFDDYWWFFMIKTGDLSWLIMIYHDWSWQITIQLGEVWYPNAALISDHQG